tara:strand:+ start:1439 stop:2281 length:843 start_codon:yes stop_codon:yes gene_type:complete
MSFEFAPLRDRPTTEAPWEGNCDRKPWEHQITAIIPVLDTVDCINLAVKLLQLQEEKPFIMVIDTGSTPENFEEICKLRGEGVEVHQLLMNGVRHPSDFPAMAMDMGFALCRTEYILATHADCFARRRDLTKWLLELCREKEVPVGYEMSPRAHDDWHGMLSHTCSLYPMALMDKIGFGWSQRRLCNIYGIVDYKPVPTRPNWPDTEILGNYIMRKEGIEPHLIGTEKNMARQKDANIDHVRSYTSGKLYSPGYFEQAQKWFYDAKLEAEARIKEWETAK